MLTDNAVKTIDNSSRQFYKFIMIADNAVIHLKA